MQERERVGDLLGQAIGERCWRRSDGEASIRSISTVSLRFRGPALMGLGPSQKIDISYLQNLFRIALQNTVNHGQAHFPHGADLVRKQRVH